MWAYDQRTGDLWRHGAVVANGYSGSKGYVNDGTVEHVIRIGPIPRGVWRMRGSVAHRRLGPCSIPLTPLAAVPNGRSGFFIHGDNPHGDRSASNGCIILPVDVRERMARSEDTLLVVF